VVVAVVEMVVQAAQVALVELVVLALKVEQVEVAAQDIEQMLA
jgi:hypothetical protein